uniref:Charged multivesicular body protein 3 n=1 Tax=Strigamia maritima TaxID=126957 RepID=T1IIU6_STRMM
MGLFGKSNGRSPKEQVNEWTTKLRKEGRMLDRQIRGIQREEEKVKKSLKDAAKKGDRDVCIILAKEVMRSRKQISKIYASKAQINSVIMSMKNQLATARLAGTLQKSTEIMKGMQSLVRVPEVAHTMNELSKEMMKAGIIEEMLDDTLSAMDDQDELEEEAQGEVDKILWEVTAGQLGKAPNVSDSLPSTSVATESLAGEDDEEVEDEDEINSMQARLQALR